MALKVTPQNLWEEAKAAEAFTLKHSKAVDALVLGMVAGTGYRVDIQQPMSEAVYENVAYEFVSQMVPSLAFNCPRVVIGDELPTSAEEQAKAETIALNQFGVDNRMGVFLRRIAVDRCFGFGVVKVYLDDSPKPEGAMWPKVSRVSPRNFIMDPEATHEDDARWFGECIEVDKEDLMQRPGFNPSAVSDLPEDEAPKQGEERKSGPSRKRVRFYEIFNVEDRTLYTIGSTLSGTGEAEWLCEPRVFRGSKRGPFVIFGHMVVPDRPFPLSELAAAKPQSDELNMHAVQIAGDAATAKRMVAYDKGDNDLAEKLTKGENGTTIGVSGNPKDALYPFEYGGPQAANLDYSAILKERLNRILGITDAQRGEVDPNATATAENYAAQGSGKREQFSKVVFQEQVGQVYSRALSLTRQSRMVRRDVLMSDGDDSPKTIGTFVGGGIPGGLEAGDEHEIKIEPYSMEYMSESLMQRRVMQTSEIIMGMAPVARQFPEWEWAKIVDDQLNALNVQGGGARYLNKEMLSMFQGVGMGMQPGMMPGQEPGDTMGQGEEGGMSDEHAALLAAASSPY